MTYLAISIAVIMVPLYLLWLYYLVCMAIARAHIDGKMNYWLWILAAPAVGVAIALDVALNYSLLALLTFDFPRKGEWTFSQRLSRLIHGGGWREKVARKVAAILDPFDPQGFHIK